MNTNSPGDAFGIFLILIFLFTFISSFVMSFGLGKLALPLFIKLNFGQQIRQEGPQAHLKKAGTPTMGGLVFILVIAGFSIVYSSLSWVFPYLLIYVILFGLVGFLDDFTKLKRAENQGLNERQKLILQIVFSLILAVINLKLSDMGSSMIVPGIGIVIDLNILYIPFLMLVMVATSNSVNLTDGLDGLASTVTFFVMIFLSAVAWKLGYMEEALFAIIVAGAVLGFLGINAYPAKCFMGDTGSMALGGAVAGVAISINLPIIIIIVGIIYVIEALSVIIQVTYYKRTKKRIFRMSPYHHHLELGGYSENKIVLLFSLVTIMAGTIAYMLV